MPNREAARGACLIPRSTTFPYGKLSERGKCPMKENKVSGGEQLGRWRSSWGPSKYRQFMKLRKRRLERRKAKHNPESPATYGRYQGYD